MPSHIPYRPGRFHSVRWFLALCFTSGAAAATFLVTNTSDSGPGSFRQAIQDANDTPGLDWIHFSIGSGGLRTITPVTLLPAVTDPVVIDGTTQPGYANRPLIELNGSTLGAGPNPGLRLLGGSSVVRGLAINRFGGDGIRVENLGTNVIQGNFIGTDPAGTARRSNAKEGILIYGATGNLIGGTNAADRNLISANGDAGVYLLNGGGNSVLGNYIGTSLSGSTSLANSNNGVAIYNSAGNRIGGEDPGARNIISGNLGSGIYLIGLGAVANVVAGNYIGTTPTGSQMLSNQADGITIVGAPRNLVGGTVSFPCNLVSGNGKAGVFISGSGATGNVLLGNFIGCDAAGTAAIGNSLSGVILSGARSNWVGGGVAGGGNLISGNKEDGVFITTNSTENLVQGNRVGIDLLGTKSIANGSNGVTINYASMNQVGGTGLEARNIISGNANYGVLFLNGASANTLQGNFIGPDPSGTMSLSNRLAGVRVDSPGNLIGGGATGAGNLVSGNGLEGLWFYTAAASNNVAQGNLVGVDRLGTIPLKNGRAGIGLSDAPANLVGGGAPGEANIISGNGDCGLFLIGAACMGNQIQGNKIGTDINGVSAVGNKREGIYAWRSATNFIGGAGPGLGNLISGNLTRGIYLTNSQGNIIQGNLIGTRLDGTGNLGQVFHGIDCETNSNFNLIGGDGAAGNRIAYSQTVYCGVRIRAGAFGNAILSNRIYANGALGIDLGAAGVLANDPCDTDSGANMQQNYPVLDGAWISGNELFVSGVLNSTPNQVFRLQFFANLVVDTSGYGEGEEFLGDLVVSTGPDCTATFSASFPTAVPEGHFIAATVTDQAQNTSEFSKSVLVRATPSLTLQPLGGGTLAVSWPATATGFVLRQARDLSAPVHWTDVLTPPILQNGRYVVVLAHSDENTYFQLWYQP